MKYIQFALTVTLILASLGISCKMVDIDKGIAEVIQIESKRMKFSDLNAQVNEVSGSITFEAHISSDYPIQRIELWGDWSGTMDLEDVIEIDELGPELFQNADMELFSFDMATYWNMWESLTTDSASDKDDGRRGFSQNISVYSAGTWGLFLVQNPSVELDRDYRFSIWHKTNKDNSLFLQIAGSTIEDVSLEEEIPGTNGDWKYTAIDFNYNDSNSVQARIATKTTGSFWVDDVSLREIITENIQLDADPSFELNLPPGTYRWHILVIDTEGAEKSKMLTVTIP